MIKDVDGLSRYIDPPSHQYIIAVFRLYVDYLVQRPIVYRCDVSNSRRITILDAHFISISSSSIIPIHVLNHSLILFSTVFGSSSVSLKSHPNPNLHVLSSLNSSTPNITWLLFNYVINFLTSIFLHQQCHTLQHLSVNRTPLLLFGKSYISPYFCIFYKILAHSLFSLTSNIFWNHTLLIWQHIKLINELISQQHIESLLKIEQYRIEWLSFIEQSHTEC